MASKEERVARLAAKVREVIAEEILADEDPDLEADIDDIEEEATQTALAAFDAVIAEALQLRSRRLPEQLPCPDCQQPCQVKYEKRRVQGRLGPAHIEEPFGRCPNCQRDFFPSTGNVAAG